MGRHSLRPFYFYINIRYLVRRPSGCRSIQLLPLWAAKMQLPRYNNERHPAEELTLLGRACSRLRFLVPSLPQPSSAQTISNRPKSPRRELPPVLTLNIPLSTPLASPRALASPARSTATAATPRSTPHGPTGITQQAPLPPLPAHSARPRQHVGVGPEDEQLAELVGASRPRRQQSKQTTKRRSCLPARGSPVRRKVIGCFISGTILVTTFTTCMCLPDVDGMQLLIKSRPGAAVFKPLPRARIPCSFHSRHSLHHFVLLPLASPPLHARVQPIRRSRALYRVCRARRVREPGAAHPGHYCTGRGGRGSRAGDYRSPASCLRPLALQRGESPSEPRTSLVAKVDKHL